MTTIVAFDIGGTSFRSARYVAGQLACEVRCTPAVSRFRHADRSVASLQKALVNYLGEEAARLQPTGGVRASVSLGVAMNAHTGDVLNASTLWGDVFEPFPLRKELEREFPNFQWVIHNDITCALVSAARKHAASSTRIALYTISTGIGCRTLVMQPRWRVPLHPRVGIQGEIGHLVVEPVFGGRLGDFECDCGGRNHLNAMCSGRGLDRVVSRLLSARNYSEDEHPIGPLAPGEPIVAGLRRCLTQKRAAAHEILSAVVVPLAKVIAEHLCFDPEVEKIFLVGGTLHALEPFYHEALLRELTNNQTYLVSRFDPNYYGRTLQFCVTDEVSSLDGAARLAYDTDLDVG